MNPNDIVRQMRGVAFALDKLEVKGRDNLDIVLGCIQTLERAASALEASLRQLDPPKKAEPEMKVEIEEVPAEEVPAE